MAIGREKTGPCSWCGPHSQGKVGGEHTDTDTNVVELLHEKGILTKWFYVGQIDMFRYVARLGKVVSNPPFGTIPWLESLSRGIRDYASLANFRNVD